MADNNLHFVELEEKTDPTGFTSDKHLVVIRGVVVGKDIPTANGPLGDNPMHVDGETWCQDFFKGGIWKQTFKDGSLRKHYAGKDMVYNSARDIFLHKQPFASWSLNGDDKWEAPIPYPTITQHGDPVRECVIYWVEEGGHWQSLFPEDPEPRALFNWDPVGLTWVAA